MDRCTQGVTMNIVVSQLQLSDRSDWELLYRAYAEFYKVPMDEDILETVWSWIFDENHQFFALIAKDSLAGSLGLMHYRAMPSPLRGKMVGFLDDLYIKPEHRGKGVVENLYSALNKSASEQNWPFVRWMTADNNYRGRGVYDKIAEKTQWLTYQMTIV